MASNSPSVSSLQQHTGTVWVPICIFDFKNGNAAAFRAMVDDFYAKHAAPHELTPISLTTGVHTITPEQAEQLLMRNKKNRVIHYPTVFGYAVQIVNGQWKMTGQPLIFTDKGELLDGQHRLWACYLIGKPITTFVVTNVPDDKELFAYVDNIRPRTGADALQIAGINGLSSHIASVVRELAVRWDDNLFRLSGPMPTVPMSNLDVLHYVTQRPEMVEGIKLVQSMYRIEAKRLGNSKVASFLGWQIRDRYGEDEVHNFFQHFTRDNELPADHPITLLRKKVDVTPKKGQRPEIVPQREVLAYSIMAFNLLYTGQKATTRSFKLDIREPFPQFVEPGAAATEAGEVVETQLNLAAQ